MSLTLKKGDHVVVISGKDRGKKGDIIKRSSDDKYFVSKVNYVKKHIKKDSKGSSDSAVTYVEAPLHRSNIMLFCVNCDSATKISVRFSENSQDKDRVCRSCSAII